MVVRVSKAEKVTTQLVAHHLKYMSVLGYDDLPLLPGKGDPLARVVIVFDEPMPQAETYMTQRVFNLFAKSLQKNGMHHAQVYITAFLKQRRMQSDWTQTELMAAKTLHRWEVDVIKPDVVVTFGVLGESTWLHNRAPYTVVNTVHPYTGLARASSRKRLFTDMGLVKAALEKVRSV